MTTPKLPHQRHHRGKRTPKLGDWRAAPGIGWQHGDVPPPPEGLLPTTVDVWRSWMTGWVAAYWTPGDLPGLWVTVSLYDQQTRHPSAALGTTLRAYMADYGLTPPGRQRLRWLAPSESATVPAAPSTTGGTPYDHLRVVERS